MASMSMNTDLKGIVALQQNYLDVLSHKTSDPDLTTKVNNLQDELSKAHAAFTEADISSSQVLTDQEKVKNIVDTEKERLLNKKQSIDSALTGKKREIELTDSYQKKQAEYNKVKIAWVFALAIYILLTTLSKSLSFIPTFIFNLIIIIVLVVTVIYSFNIYIEISRREKINFDKLDLPAPAITVPNAAKTVSSREVDLLGGMNLYGCVGSYCCNDGTKWDRDISKCVHDTEYDPNAIKDTSTDKPEPFTTLLGNMGLNKRRININTVKENYANEYDNYSKV